MRNVIKAILKVLLIVFCIIVIGVISIAGLRAYNYHKYGNAVSLTEDVTDISQYPTELEGIKVEYVDHGAFQGFHLIPNNKKYKGIIVCYGGSDGSPFFEVARKYAEEGYETLSVFMFGMNNQPKELSKVPLEQFADVLDYINNNIEDDDPITIMGASKGAEYVLNLAAKYDEISNVILLAPVAYSFSGLNNDNVSSSSSWTWENKEVPYVDIKKASFGAIFKSMLFPMMIGSPVTFRDIYAAALDADENRDEKLIPVQNIKGDILIIVGEDDQMMDTLSMAELIKAHNSNTIVCSYENAGHMFSGDGVASEFGMRMKLGGTVEGNEKAMVESGKVMKDFLEKHHSK